MLAFYRSKYVEDSIIYKENFYKTKNLYCIMKMDQEVEDNENFPYYTFLCKIYKLHGL